MAACMYHQRVSPPPVVEKVLDLNDQTLSFTTQEPDVIMGFSDPEDQPRVKMSCGHAVDPNSLTDWCRSLLDKQQWEFYCPAVLPGPGSTKRCKSKWEYSEVRKKAALTTHEQQYFEFKISEYAYTICDYKECPGCGTFVERLDKTNLRVYCQICAEDFCWNCKKVWTGSPRSFNRCGNPECQHPSLHLIRDAPMITLIGQQVPQRRACPTCGNVVEHKQEACKMTFCPRCKNEFCFLCLMPRGTCLATAPGSYYRGCKKGVAPKQTEIPVWLHPRH